MKKRINFIEGLFSNEGHYIDEIEKYKYLETKYELVYFINGKVNELDKKRLKHLSIVEYDCGHSLVGSIKFFMKVFNDCKKEDFNFVMSCKYVSLFIASKMSFFYKYFLLVHFFPTVNVGLYKLIFNNLINNINGLFVFEEYVANEIQEKINSNKKINILHARDIKYSIREKIDEKFTVSFIGAMNIFKEVDSLLSLLNFNYYENIKFKFYSKNITNFISNKYFNQNDIEIIDAYLTSEDYNNYMKDSDFIFLSYKYAYGIRVPAMVFDSLSNGCQLICNDNPSFNYYIEKYNCGYVFRDEDELHKILTNLQKLNINEEIYDDYSQQTREKLFLNIVENFYGDKRCDF